jgi:2-polyprenyl-3-methyl-5-hydroxy-6-metoxy-1,4-benzoquinol methylase
MDQPNIPAADLKLNLYELEFINQWLGGHAATISGIASMVYDQNKEYTILDIGCGGGDTILALEKWATSKGLKVSFTGLDMSSIAIAHAQENCKHKTNVDFICQPFQSFIPAKNYDLIICSLFTHHLYDDDLNDLLVFMNRYSDLGFVVNDLERNALAWLGIKVLTMLFSKSYLVKHDAPLSVRRGFIKSEWVTLLNNNGITDVVIRNAWAFRHLLIQRKGA